jgi:hypothetical protein
LTVRLVVGRRAALSKPRSPEPHVSSTPTPGAAPQRPLPVPPPAPSEPKAPVTAPGKPSPAGTSPEGGVVGSTVVAKQDLPMFVRPGMLTPIVTFPRGTRLKILSVEGDWLMVEYQDRQWGRRVGYVQRRLVTTTEP